MIFPSVQTVISARYRLLLLYDASRAIASDYYLIHRGSLVSLISFAKWANANPFTRIRILKCPLPAASYSCAAETIVYEQQVVITNIIFAMLCLDLIIEIHHASLPNLLKPNNSRDMIDTLIHGQILEIRVSFLQLVSVYNRYTVGKNRNSKVPVLQLDKYTGVFSLFYFILYSAKYEEFHLHNLFAISITLGPCFVQFSMR